MQRALLGQDTSKSCFIKINLWEGKLGWYDRWDLFRRNYLRKAKQFPGYPQYSNKLDQEQYREHIEPRLRFVLQEFYPGLG
jgi:hypothetical protein